MPYYKITATTKASCDFIVEADTEELALELWEAKHISVWQIGLFEPLEGSTEDYESISEMGNARAEMMIEDDGWQRLE